MNAPDEFMTAEQIGLLLNVSRHTALRWMHKGDINSFRDGRNIRAPRSSVEAFIASKMTRRAA